MQVEPLGDSAYILRDLDVPAHALARALNARPPIGLQEAVASYESVGLYVDPEIFDISALELPRNLEVGFGRKHVVPVCYELGEDLSAVCSQLNLTVAELVQAHAGQEYQCYAVGFCPGFAYLGYLPAALEGVPRRANPRTQVPAGAVAITGRQTAVYPLRRPGGWSLIGQTPLCLVDVEDRYFPISAGDSVRFEPIGRAEYERRQGERL
jgi:inhibitor of KinA